MTTKQRSSLRLRAISPRHCKLSLTVRGYCLSPLLSFTCTASYCSLVQFSCKICFIPSYNKRNYVLTHSSYIRTFQFSGGRRTVQVSVYLYCIITFTVLYCTVLYCTVLYCTVHTRRLSLSFPAGGGGQVTSPILSRKLHRRFGITLVVEVGPRFPPSLVMCWAV